MKALTRMTLLLLALAFAPAKADITGRGAAALDRDAASTIEKESAAVGSLLIVSAGASSTSEKFNPLNEHLNRGNQYSLRYEGKRFGLRLDHSVHGGLE